MGCAACFVRASVALALFVALSGCDELQKFQNKQTEVQQRVEKVEQRLNEVESQLNDLTNQKEAAPASFEGCVLENMRGISSNLAAESVKEACLRKASVALNFSEWLKARAQYGQIYGYTGEQHFGLYVSFTNSSRYTITEMTIVIVDKKTKETNTYTARSFPAPLAPGTIIAGLAPDKTLGMRMPPGKCSFTLTIGETAPDPNKFFDQYAWDITSVKGFVD